MKRQLIAAFIFTAFAIANPCWAKDKEGGTDKTVKHLEHAYNGEMNAHEYYLACSQKADEEGYHQVASLFRAAAESESIHAANHARVLRAMHVEPRFEPEHEAIKSTKENVKASYKDEMKESTKMYPSYIDQAREEGNSDAARTFAYAREAEAQHAKYFKQAEDNLENWRNGTRTFLVCETCGYLTDEQSLTKCPSCAGEKFRKIE